MPKMSSFFRKGTVHEFYRLKLLITLEQVNASVRTSIVRLQAGPIGCCKLSLYASESCDEHAVYF